MKLFELQPDKGSQKLPKRKGRGHGSGNGETAGRESWRSEISLRWWVRIGFEGGQMPLYESSKRGFNNIFAKVYSVVNVSDLNVFDDGTVVDESSLREKV